jgi:hypothetical protein
MSDPKEPVLISEPKPPFVRLSASLTSGKRGTQDMMVTPNVKKRILR